jgi:phosphatidate phosphatase APP1
MQNLTIIPYRGFSNGSSVYISGHAFDSYRLKPPKRKSIVQNLVQMIKRYSLKPAPYQPVMVYLDGKKYPLVADENGFFKGVFDHKMPVGKHRYFVSSEGLDEKFGSSVFVSEERKVGVLSDIDDTLLLSYVNQWYKMLWLLIAKNALTRNPVPQLGTILDMIRDFNHQELPSDFFYVSNSEWNLYDFLKDFFEENNLPEGAFSLQRFKSGFRDAVFTPQKKDNHKPQSIRFILDFFKNKKFILLGDNGQKDLEIYASICQEYASRIEAVIIRDVGKLKYRRKNKEFEETIVNLQIPVKHIR